MKLSTASVLLKIVLVISTIAVAFVVFWCVPVYMRHVIDVRPDLAGWDYWMRAYALLVGLPVWAAIAILWRIFDTIPKNDAFSAENARRFQWITRLAEGDLCIVGAFAAFLVISGVTPPFLIMTFGGAIFAGIAAAIVFHVLGGLVRNAAEFKQDSDMTI